MDKKVKPKMRYTDDELSLNKSLFCENEELLIILRKFFIQEKLSVEEEARLVTLRQPATIALLKKTLVPKIDGNAPFFQITDLWVNIDTKKDLYPAMLDMEARYIVVRYLEQQFSRLEGNKTDTDIKFSDLIYNPDKDDNTNFAELAARNTILSHVDFQLMQLLTLAGQKEETVAQTKERLMKDSAK